VSHRAAEAPNSAARRSHLTLTAAPWMLAVLQVFVAGRGFLNYDTKYMLHVDAGSLMSLSRHVWDPLQYGGYVAHQAVGYLWPSGPFHWLGQTVGVDAWVMQRLWLLVVFGVAGSGVRAWLSARGHGPTAALVAAVLYQTSPFVLAYQARTSVMLLPWACLGWLALCTARGVKTTGWRHAAAAALLIGTAGGINATALLLVLPALLLVALSELSERRASLRGVLAFGLRSAAFSLLVSLWWMTMVVLQGRYGSRVLFFSETLEDVSLPATAFEVMRGFGYWLDYVGLDGAPVTSAAASSLGSMVAVAGTLAFPVAAFFGLVVARRDARRLASVAMLTGLVLAVNVHPIESPARLWNGIAGNPDGWLALALRSSTRAIPVLLLGMSLAVASLLDSTELRRTIRMFASFGHRRLTVGLRPAVAVLVVCAAALGVPARVTDGVADTTLTRRTNLPPDWSRLGEELDRYVDPGRRVLQLPGQDFASYEWGYTGESALLGAQRGPILIRELLPLGDEQYMNLLNAVNDAGLEGRLRPSRLDELAGVLGLGAVLVPSDLDDARYATPDQATFLRINGLDADGATDVDGHLIWPSSDGAGVIRAQRGHTILLGDGYGLVAAAGWKLLGQGTVVYAGDQSDDGLASDVSSASRVVVTDSNRIRALHWRTARDAYGFSEDGTERTSPLGNLQVNRRLRVFESERPEDATRFEQRGPSSARATLYGDPLGYRPEDRPFAAIDGRLETAWSVRSSAAPEAVLQVSSEQSVSSLVLVQDLRPSRSTISEVAVQVDDSPPLRVALDGSSLGSTGQRVDLPVAGRVVRIRPTATMGSGRTAPNDHVGFSEVVIGDGPSIEVGVLPTRGLEWVAPGQPLAYVLSRDRAPTWDGVRRDPEQRFRRQVLVPHPREFEVSSIVATGPADRDSAELPDDVTIQIDGAPLTLVRVGAGPLYQSSSPVSLGAGDHIIDSAGGSVLLDEIVLSDPGSRSADPEPARTSLPGLSPDNSSPTSRTAVLQGCSEGCWLVLGESHNRGWRLSVGGVDRGPARRVDGGVNGWLLPATPDGAAVRLQFGPQRVANVAQIASLVGALLCVGLVLAGRRRSADTRAHEALPETASSPRSRPMRVASASGITAVAGLLLLADRWMITATVVVAIAAWMRDSRTLLRVGVAATTASLAVGLALMIRTPPSMNFFWSATVERVHAALMASMVLTVVGAFLADDRGSERPEPK